MQPSPYTANELFAKELEDELMKYTASYDGNNVNMCSVDKTEKAHGNAEEVVDKTEKGHGNAEEVVDITERSKSVGKGKIEAKSPDATESSSSFDDSDSGDENGDALGESEALSGFCGNAASELDSDIFEDLFKTRNKRLTDHWKTYIRPLAWRCKWTELQIKKLEEQAQICDRKIEECQQKKVQLEKSTLEINGMKSLPLSENYARTDVLRRKKRRKVEATEDAAKYLSSHNLFSYYDNRESLFPKGALWNFSKRKRARNKQYFNADDEFHGFDEAALCHRHGNDDNTLEQLYRKTMSLQSHLGKLKTRVNKVTSENPEKFSCDEYLKLLPPTPHNALLGSPSNTAVHPNNVVQMPVDSYVASQQTSGNDTNVAFILRSTVPGQGAAVPHVDRNDAQGYSADANGNGDNLLVYNRRAKGKMTVEEVNAQPTQRQAGQSSNNSPPVAVAQPNPPMDDEPPQKMRSISHIIGPQSKSNKGGTRRGSS